MALDIAIIGVVFALILLVIFFSAVVLYLAFRIKETFRKETRRGATIAKIGFLIGILFLAGGIFYFFANTLTNIAEPNPTASPTPTISPSPSPTASSSPTASPFPTTTPAPTPTPTPAPTLTLSVSRPSQITMSTPMSISFTISNPTDSIAHGAYIETEGLFADFAVQSSTYEINGNVINIGDVPSGTTIVFIDLLSPDRAGAFTYTIALNFQEMTAPVTKGITILVRGN
jgi:hypothetical protein